MEELRKCSRCASTMELKYFLINRKGEHFKCCQNCNKKQSIKLIKASQHNNINRISEKVVCEICGSETKRCNQSRHMTTIKCQQVLKTKTNKPLSFVDYYVKLPMINFIEEQDMDMRIDAIVVLNHSIEFEPTIKRYDNQIFTYKEFTKLDSVEYDDEGANPLLDYLPDDYVAPVLLKINCVTYRASCLTWSTLTDLCDAIKLRKYEENHESYPIYVKAGKCPMYAIYMASGYPYLQRLQNNDDLNNWSEI